MKTHEHSCQKWVIHHHKGDFMGKHRWFTNENPEQKPPQIGIQSLSHQGFIEAGAEDTTSYAGQNGKKTNKNTLLNQGFMGIFYRI